MPKPTLIPQFHDLEHELVNIFLDGLHYWRPDLAFPESTSDVQGGIRAIMEHYELIKRREPIDLPWSSGQYHKIS